MENVADFINVAVRIKPAFSDDSIVCNLKVVSNNPHVLCLSDRHSFTFDHIFDGDANQGTVFNDIIKPMVDKFLLGYNCTVFTYGQTGTGKTYTIGNPENVDTENMGIINRTFKDIFENSINPDMEICTEVSLYEIYNEKVFDLLDDKKIPLQVKGFAVPSLKKVPVHDMVEAQELFLIASKNRKTAGTSQNVKSSRSHAIYTLFCTIRNGNSIKSSKFNFVDLAGSESVRKTGSEGNTFHEGVNINKGLLCLGQVINALCSNQNYIPYRQAIITSLLRDSLSKKNYTTLIACVSSKISDTTETLQTLDFAKRVKRICSKPEVYSAIDNSFKKPAVDLTKCFTPMKAIRPVQTSTAFNRPRAVPMVASYIPNETRKYPMDVTMDNRTIIDPTISISPIIRKCVEQIEAKLSTTLAMLVNEKAKKLTQSIRISPLCQNCDEMAIDENDESIVINKRRRTDRKQNEVLKNITVKSIDSTNNRDGINNSKNHENLQERNRNDSSHLLEDFSEPLVNVSKSMLVNEKAKTLSRRSARISASCHNCDEMAIDESIVINKRRRTNGKQNEILKVITVEREVNASKRVLVNEKAKTLLRRSARLSVLCQNYDEMVVDESVVVNKKRTDRKQNEVPKDITIKSIDSANNREVVNNSKNHENLQGRNRNDSSHLLEDFSEPLVSVSKDILVNEKAKKLLRRSARISAVHQRYSEIGMNENNEGIMINEKRTNKTQNEVLKDITVKSIDSADNRRTIINSKTRENLQQENRNNSSHLLEDLSQPLVNVSKSRSKIIDLKQTTSSPNVLADYSKFTKKLKQNLQPNQVFDSPVSYALAPASRRGIQLKTNNSKEPPEASCVGCSGTTKAKRRSVEEDGVENKKIKNLKTHSNHVLKILNYGTLKSLTSLQTIGLKSAEKILLYRELCGKFETIQEVENVLIRGKAYKRFMEANFLL